MFRTEILVAFFAALFLVACSKGHDDRSSDRVQTKDVTYSDPGGTPLKGFLAYTGSRSDRKPGVLVVHEWWGLNDYPRKRARMLADLGYTAMAIDMYGDGRVAATPQDAQKYATEVMTHLDTAAARFTAALNYLKSQPMVDTTRIAAIGYCFGGGVVLQMARTGVPLAGVVSFHGGLSTQHPAQMNQVRAKILVCNGADDRMNPPEAIDAFRAEMDTARANYKLINYPGAVHAFTNPQADSLGKLYNMPIAYNAAADTQSWQDMQSFLKQIFEKK